MHGKFRKILAGIGVLVIVVAVLYAAMLAKSAGELRQACAALEADGRPLRPMDIMPAPIPDAQNAAIAYLSAVSMLRAEPAGEKNLLKHLAVLSGALFRESDDPEKRAGKERELAELRQWMGRDIIASALSAIEQGSQRPACQLPRDYSNGLPVDDPVGENLRDLLHILGANACFEAEAGRLDRAWDTVPTLLRLADALRSDLISSSQWTRMGMVQYSCRIIQKLCEIAPPDEDDCRAAEAVLKDLGEIEPLVRASDGERLLRGEWLFNLPEEKLFEALREGPLGGTGAASDVFYRLSFRFTTFKPRFVADHATYLQFMRKSTQLLQGPCTPRESAASREIRDLAQRGLVTSRLSLRVYGMKWAHCNMCASVRATRAMLALLDYRRVHGVFPPTLDALNLKGVVDPFTREPLRYRAEGEGFVIYSVGEDMKDNGGSPRHPRQGTDYDLVWHFPRAAYPED